MDILDSEEDLLLAEMHLEDLIAELHLSAACPSRDARTRHERLSDGHTPRNEVCGHSPRDVANRQ